MRYPRIFVDQPLDVGTEAKLDDGAKRHLRQVLRLRDGDPAILFNGDGREYPGRIVVRGRNDLAVALVGSTEVEPPPRLHITLGLAISRGERMDLAIQKSVELGVTAIAPLVTERSAAGASGERLEKRREHWRRILVSACEQSGRCRLPVLHQIATLADWLPREGTQTRILLSPGSKQTLEQLAHPGRQVVLLSGPEGGLSSQECTLALAGGFRAVGLGPRVMRTETAPMAAIAAIQILWGDFRTL